MRPPSRTTRCSLAGWSRPARMSEPEIGAGPEPLHAATIGGPGSSHWDPARQRAVIEYLVEAGADPNAAALVWCLRHSIAPACRNRVSALRGRAVAPWRRPAGGERQRINRGRPRSLDDRSRGKRVGRSTGSAADSSLKRPADAVGMTLNIRLRKFSCTCGVDTRGMRQTVRMAMSRRHPRLVVGLFLLLALGGVSRTGTAPRVTTPGSAGVCRPPFPRRDHSHSRFSAYSVSPSPSSASSVRRRDPPAQTTAGREPLTRTAEVDKDGPIWGSRRDGWRSPLTGLPLRRSGGAAMLDEWRA